MKKEQKTWAKRAIVVLLAMALIVNYVGYDALEILATGRDAASLQTADQIESLSGTDGASKSIGDMIDDIIDDLPVIGVKAAQENLKKYVYTADIKDSNSQSVNGEEVSTGGDASSPNNEITSLLNVDVKFRIPYSDVKAYQDANEDTMDLVYELPGTLIYDIKYESDGVTPKSYPLTGKAGIGTYTLYEDNGKLYIRVLVNTTVFDDITDGDLVDKDGNPKVYDGGVSFWANLDATKVNDENKIVTDFETQGDTIHIVTGVDFYPDVAVSKTCDKDTDVVVDPAAGTITYNYHVTVSSEYGTSDEVINFADQITSQYPTSISDITVKDANGSVVSGAALSSSDGKNIAGTLPALSKNSSYDITYKVTETIGAKEKKTVYDNNKVKVTTETITTPKEASVSTSTDFVGGEVTDLNVEKTATDPVFDGNVATFTYTIKISSEYGTDGNITVDDQLTKFLDWMPSDATTDPRGTHTASDLVVNKTDKDGNKSPAGGLTLSNSANIGLNDSLISGTLPALAAGEGYEITYTVTRTNTETSGFQPYNVYGGNKVIVKDNSHEVPKETNPWGQQKDPNAEPDPDEPQPGEKPIPGIGKQPHVDGNELTWTVNVNTDNQDLDGCTLSDVMKKDYVELSDPIIAKVTEDNGTVHENVKLPVSFGKNEDGTCYMKDANNQTYSLSTLEKQIKFEYVTVLPEKVDLQLRYDNTATLTRDGKHKNATADYTKKNENVLTKQHVKTVVNSEDPSKSEVYWDSFIDIKTIQPDDIYVDKVTQFSNDWDLFDTIVWFDDPDIKITYKDESGTEKTIPSTDYSVTLNKMYDTATNPREFVITFNKEIVSSSTEPGFHITYKNEGDMSSFGSGSNFDMSNRAKFTRGSFSTNEVIAPTTLTYPGTLVAKEDLNGLAEEGVSTHEKKDGEDSIIYYRAHINASRTASGEITFTDTLPEGTTLVKEQWSYGGRTSNADGFLFHFYDPDLIGNTPADKESTCWDTGKDGIYRYNPAPAYSKEMDIRNTPGFSLQTTDTGFTVTVPEELYLAYPYGGTEPVAQVELLVYYAVKVPDNKLDKALVNKAVAADDALNSSAEVTSKVLSKKVDKKIKPTKSASKDVDYNEELNQISYIVDLNPNAADISVGDSYEVSDALKFTSNTSTYKNFITGVSILAGSMKLTDTKTGEAVDYEIVAGGTEGDTYSFTLKVPDERALTLEYTYQLTFDSKQPADFTLANQFKVAGSTADANQDAVSSAFSDSGNDGYLTDAFTSVTLAKADSSKNAKFLAGATFTLDKLVIGNDGNPVWEPVDEGTYSTSAEGTVQIDNIFFNTVYRLHETTPPSGYELPEDDYYLYYDNVNSSNKPYATVSADAKTKIDTYIAKALEITAAGGITIDNDELGIGEINVSGKKIWNDDSDKDGSRPDEITVNLLQNGTKIDSKKVTGNGDEWSFTFTKLPEKDTIGNAYVYTVTEDEVDGYKTSIDGYTITNTHTPDDKKPIKISKVDIADGVELPGATIQILDDTGAVIKEWTSKSTPEEINDLTPGKTYTLRETVAPEGYAITTDTTFTLDDKGEIDKSKTTTKVSDEGVLLVEDAMTSIKISKVDIADGAELPGAHIQILLGNTVVKEWDSTNQPKEITGLKTGVTYTLRETVAPNGYGITTDTTFKLDDYGKVDSSTTTPSKTEDEETILLVEDELLPTVTLKGTKTWTDDNNRDGVRPTSVTITLKVSEDGDTWTDAKDKDGKTLTATITSTVTSYEFTGLKKYAADGKTKLQYKVVETASEGGDFTKYTPSGDPVRQADDDNLIIHDLTNTHEIETTQVSGSKTWKDNNDAAKARPQSITINLNKSGDGVEAGIYKSEVITTGEWNFTNLPVYENGHKITYTITEETVTGYTTVVDGYNVTNTYNPGKTSITVKKVWNDGSDQDGIRPATIAVQLYANGEASGDPVNLSSGNKSYDAEGNVLPNVWEYAFNNLPAVDDEGKAISYTVSEVNKVNNYDTSSNVSGNVTTITNTHEPETTELSIVKYWSDGDDQDGIRPDSITVKLYKQVETAKGSETYGDETLVENSTKVIDATSADADGVWHDAYTDLPQYEAGKKIKYTIKEDAVEDYATQINGGVIQNSHTPATVSVKGQKIWSDGDNQDGIRPDSITVVLKANGDAVSGKTATLPNQDGSWTYEFTGLDKYKDGDPIVYTIDEQKVPDEYQLSGEKVSEVGNVITYDITNTYNPDTTSLTVQKVWDDNKNQDAIRPTSIKVQLKADGKEYGDPIDMDASMKVEGVVGDDRWTYTWNDLPMKADGKIITYTVEEVGATGGDISKYTSSVKPGTVPVIENKHVPETTSIKGVKSWVDGENQDGIRPDSVTIILSADGKEYKTTEAKKDEGYVFSFTDLPKYKNVNGAAVEIKYTLSEEDVDGYELVSNEYDENTDSYTLVNEHTPDTVEIKGSKTWENDTENNRPASITISLYKKTASTEKTLVESKTIEKSDNMTWSWTGDNALPKYEKGEEITYTIEEAKVTNYDTKSNGYSFTNTFNPGKTSISVTKVWDDAGNQDGKRPANIQVQLLKNGEPEGQAITLSSANVAHDAEGNNIDDQWTYTWSDLNQLDTNGDEIVYSVVETEDTIAALKEIDYECGNPVKGTDGNYTITNSYEPAEISITVDKEWVDTDANSEYNTCGHRPSSITFNLVVGDDVIQSKTLEIPNTEKGIVSWTFDKLPKYKDGVLIQYDVTEDEIEGYEADINTPLTMNVSINKYSVLMHNLHECEEVTVSGKKIWNDSDNQDGKRPDDITVVLYKKIGDSDKVKVEEKKVSENEEWKYKWENLPQYANVEGKPVEIIYSVEEESVPNGYSVDYEDYDIKNSYTPGKVSVPVKKVWSDNSNQDGKRPGSIYLQLYADGKPVDDQTITLTGADNTWTYTFKDLDEKKDGNAIVYTVQESAVKDGDLDAYTCGDPVKGSDGTFTFTNTHETEKISISGEKTWSDANNSDNKRPTEIVVKVMNGDTVAASKTVKVNSNGKWTYEFTNLDKYKDGELINYTLAEEVDENYEASIDTMTMSKDVDEYTCNIENSYEAETISVPVSKKWTDDDNRDCIRPDSVTIALYADGKDTGKRITLSSADVAHNSEGSDITNQWSGKFEKLAKYKNVDGEAVEIEYTVVELNTDTEPLKSYTSAVTGTQAAGYQIENKYTPEKTSVKVTKEWTGDNNDADRNRPASIVVTLVEDGVDTNKTATLSAAGNWTATFTDLLKYKNVNGTKTEIQYTVKEETITHYVLDEITGNQTDGYTITNKYNPGKVSVSGKKTWADESNQDGKRPTTLTINLLADGKPKDSVTLKASDFADGADEWTYSFDDLPEYVDGEKVIYTVEEDTTEAKAAGYTCTQNDNDFVNSLTPEETEVSITKIWDDNDNQDGMRTSVIINLYDGGTDAIDEVQLKLDEHTGNQWSYTFTGLPKYKEGKEIVYTVDEEKVEGYTTSYSKDTFTITNTHKPEKTEISGEKFWEDNDDQDGKRPKSIQINVMNGTKKVADKKVTPDENGKWTYKFDDLDKYENGNVINYTIEEVKVDDYDSQVAGYNVTNTHLPSVINIRVSKAWDDQDDENQLRPEEITVGLYAGNTQVGQDVVLNEGNDWSNVWKDLPEYENGKKIDYHVLEGTVDNYKASYSDLSKDNEIVVTNEYTPGLTSKTVVKDWDDEDNAYKARPKSIKVQLYADGEKLGKPVTLSEKNDWTYTWDGLVILNKGIEVDYTVEEITEVDGYETEQFTDEDGITTIVNTYIPPEEDEDVPPHSPKTGDTAYPVAASAIMLMVGAAFVVMMADKRRKRA